MIITVNSEYFLQTALTHLSL